MGEPRKRYPHDAPIETEGMGGAGGGDIDDVGDVGYPRKRPSSEVPGDLQAAGQSPAGTGDDIEIARQMGGGSIDMPPEVPNGNLDVDDIRTASGAGDQIVRGETGTVTGVTTGAATDEASDGPGTPWDDLSDGLRESSARGTDTPETQPG